jgi:hypothetical protein
LRRPRAPAATPPGRTLRAGSDRTARIPADGRPSPDGKRRRNVRASSTCTLLRFRDCRVCDSVARRATCHHRRGAGPEREVTAAAPRKLPTRGARSDCCRNGRRVSGNPLGASRASSRGVGVGGPRARAAIPRRGGPRAPTRGDPSGGSRTAVDRARQRPVRHPRPGLRRVRALVLQTLLGLPQRLAPPLTGAQLLGSSSPRARSVELVLPPVDVQRLGEDLPRDLAEIAVGVHRRVGRHVRAINRHDADRHKPVRAHKPSTPENASASGRSCRQRDSAIVE